MFIRILDAKFNELPDIEAYGAVEEEAVQIFVILLNASMLQGKDRLYSNVDRDNGIIYTTFVVGITDFETLKEYMKDVYDVTVVLIEE